MFVLGFPLLLIPFAIYNMIAFLLPGVQVDLAGDDRAHDVRARIGC